MWPISRVLCVCAIKASCSRVDSREAANSAKAREKVAGLGAAPARLQPHRRRRVLSVIVAVDKPLPKRALSASKIIKKSTAKGG